ncbi:MAG: urease accessory protein UreD [Firmicutes bacterium]|nr:urease accessory protein UreD [Bacillota bacterium]
MTSNHFGKTSEMRIKASARDGKTILEDVYFTVPYKIMQPFEKEDGSGGISVMPLCASAGIMAGDVQKFSYCVGEGADLEILSQSFEKIHKMDEGSACRQIHVDVASGGTLYYNPQPVIPFAGSAFDSDMEIHLEDATSKLFLLDILSCGRAVSGERFAYRRFSSKVKIYRGGRLVYRDNTCYEPEKMPMEGIGMYEGYSHMANIFLSGCVDEAGAFDGGKTLELQEKIWGILEANPDCEGGVSQLASGDLAVRVFGNRAQILQGIAEKIKKIF